MVLWIEAVTAALPLEDNVYNTILSCISPLQILGNIIIYLEHCPQDQSWIPLWHKNDKHIYKERIYIFRSIILKTSNLKTYFVYSSSIRTNKSLPFKFKRSEILTCTWHVCRQPHCGRSPLPCPPRHCFIHILLTLFSFIFLHSETLSTLSMLAHPRF